MAMNTLKFPGSCFLASLWHNDIYYIHLSLWDLYVDCSRLVSMLEGNIGSESVPHGVGRAVSLAFRLEGCVLSFLWK